jgi:hypothetical protein
MVCLFKLKKNDSFYKEHLNRNAKFDDIGHLKRNRKSKIYLKNRNEGSYEAQTPTGD